MSSGSDGHQLVRRAAGQHMNAFAWVRAEHPVMSLSASHHGPPARQGLFDQKPNVGIAWSCMHVFAFSVGGFQLLWQASCQ
jgi:hypothetical protein